MANSMQSALLTLCLIFLVTADGRTMLQAHLDNFMNTTYSRSRTALLDSSSSTTTNSNDVEGLTTLIKQFPSLTGDQFPNPSSDPCYPQKLIWIACSNGDVRRVTALFLGTQNLYGYLPDFSSMDALQIIDLHRNSLYGSIPEFLGMLPELTYLDLSDNLFDGALPASLANNKKIELNLAGNSLQLVPPATIVFPPPFPAAEFLMPPPPDGDRKRIKMKRIKLQRILRIAIPTTSVTTAGVATYAVWRRYRHRRRRRRNDKHAPPEIESTTTESTQAPTPRRTPTPTSTPSPTLTSPAPTPPPSPVIIPCGATPKSPPCLLFVVDEYY